MSDSHQRTEVLNLKYIQKSNTIPQLSVWGLRKAAVL